VPDTSENQPPTESVALNVTGGGQRRIEREGRLRPARPDLVLSAGELNPKDVARKLAEETRHG